MLALSLLRALKGEGIIIFFDIHALHKNSFFGVSSQRNYKYGKKFKVDLVMEFSLKRILIN